MLPNFLSRSRGHSEVFRTIVVQSTICAGLYNVSKPVNNTRRFSDFIHAEARKIARAMIKKRQQSGKERREAKKHWQDRYRFIDKARIRAAGGAGGKGNLASETMMRKLRLKPSGGHGGAGGSVIVVAHKDEQSLRMKHHAQAPNGTNGGKNKMLGRSGDNLIVRVPCGVIVKRVLDHDEEWDEDTKQVVRDESKYVQDDFAFGNNFWFEDEVEDHKGDESEEERDGEPGSEGEGDEYTLPKWGVDFFVDEGYDESEKEDAFEEHELVTLADLDQHGAYVVVAKGGRGGVGSMIYSSSNTPTPPTPLLTQQAQPEQGEIVHLELELKLIADVGLVGFPNAGKSSLLRAMSRATPKVAPYPFTTLHPLMGMVEYRDGTSIRVADIPGLIDGASQGRGCGHSFLRHVERTKALLYIVDIAGSERDPLEDLRVLVNELGSYGDGDLLERRAIVMANKIDLVEKQRVPEIVGSLAELSDSLGIQRLDDVHAVSAGVSGKGLGALSRSLRGVVEQANADREQLLADSAMF
mmetsp:Transcript_24138/g.66883  ORF Transcript_24138/g.66883 Transcript_24138/m.66883 type:complete len:525 (-) Transcript_24138:22-1596(-)